MTVYAYARVSTKGQDLNDQISQLKKKGVDSSKIYSEKFTGTTADRPQFDKLMDTVKQDDEIIVTKLDRFARNTKDALNWLDYLLKKGVKVNILNFGVVENTPMGRFMITTLSAVAELERSFIVERTQSGKKYAKSHRPDFSEGRPHKTKNSHVGNKGGQGAKYQVIYEYTKEHSVRQTAKDFSIAPSTVSRIKKMFKD